MLKYRGDDVKKWLVGLLVLVMTACTYDTNDTDDLSEYSLVVEEGSIRVYSKEISYTRYDFFTVNEDKYVVNYNYVYLIYRDESKISFEELYELDSQYGELLLESNVVLSVISKNSNVVEHWRRFYHQVSGYMGMGLYEVDDVFSITTITSYVANGFEIQEREHGRFIINYNDQLGTLYAFKDHPEFREILSGAINLGYPVEILKVSDYDYEFNGHFYNIATERDDITLLNPVIDVPCMGIFMDITSEYSVSDCDMGDIFLHNGNVVSLSYIIQLVEDIEVLKEMGYHIFKD